MKPYVICLMHSSLDGRTHPSRWRPKGAGTDWFEKIHDELGGDAWVIGRVTGSEFAKGKPYPATAGEKFPRENWFARRDAKTYGVVLDAQGKIGWGRSDIGGDPIVVRADRGRAGFASRRAARRGCVLHLRRQVRDRPRADAGHPQSRARGEAPAGRGRRRRQWRVPARRPDRRIQPDPQPRDRRRQGRALRVRFDGRGQRQARAARPR